MYTANFIEVAMSPIIYVAVVAIGVVILIAVTIQSANVTINETDNPATDG